MSEEAHKAGGGAAAVEVTEGSLLDTILTKGFKARKEDQRTHATGVLAEFVRKITEGHIVPDRDVMASIDHSIAQLDGLLSAQLNEILHHPDLQKLESTWRGLHYLVDKSETGPMLEIRVLNASKKDLLDDLKKAVEFDQSGLFKAVYEQEFGTPGGKPYGLLIGDYEFGKHPQDIAMLEKIGGVAAAAHAPFISAASAEMFGWDSFTELAGPRDLSMIFQGAEYTKWRSFRDSDDARYVGLTLPHVLARLPYGEETDPVEAFRFEEDVTGRDHSKYLWTNAAYAFGTNVTSAFSMYGWTAAIRGREGGGVVEGLPVHNFPTDDGEIASKCPTELAITDRREAELDKLGFIPLSHYKDTDYAVFFGARSAQKAKKYDTDLANANADLSTQLPYIMATSRFAHYLKVMCRDKIGAFMERKDVEEYLTRWISNYVLLDDKASQEQKSRLPLREARVEVSENKARPGSYNATFFLRPHFQLEELTVSLRLVSQLPAPKG
jgi:type VI secretion system protein ImpC